MFSRDRHSTHLFASRRYLLLAPALVVLVLLTSCGASDNEQPSDTDRQFAGGPRSTETIEPTSTLVTEASTLVPPTIPPTVPLTDLIATRGAPEQSVVQIGDGIAWVDEAGLRPIILPEGARVVQVDVSATGTEAAILMLTPTGLQVGFLESGQREFSHTWPLVMRVLGGDTATPEASPVSGTPQSVAEMSESKVDRLFITWMPQRHAALVSGPGVLATIDINGEIRPVVANGLTGTVLYATSSPANNAIAVQTSQPDGSQSVYIIRDGRAREVHAIQAKPGQGISDLQWLPSSTGLVYVVGQMQNGALYGGTLFIHELSHETARVLATSGQGGPSSVISAVEVSPNGRSVAYAILTHDQSSWYTNSVWVRSIQGQTGEQIQGMSRSTVQDTAWISGGLVVVAPDGDTPVLLARRDASTDVLGPTADATPGASPVTIATPVGTPPAGATPIASPRPVGTPVASPAIPLGSPIATPPPMATPVD